MFRLFRTVTPLSIVLVAALPTLAALPVYFSVEWNDKPIGFSVITTSNVELDGRKLLVVNSQTTLKVAVLGAERLGYLLKIDHPTLSFLSPQTQVTLVPAFGDRALCDRILDRTARFVRMRADGKPAMIYERRHLGKQVRLLIVGHVPQPELARARRIDHTPARVQGKHLNVTGRMSAFAR